MSKSITPFVILVFIFASITVFAADQKAPALKTASKKELSKKAEELSLDEEAVEEEVEKKTSRSETKSEEDNESKGYGKTHGLLGPVTFGPAITLLGVPRPFAAGLEAKYIDLASFAVNYGFLPELTISSAKVKFKSWDVRLRWHLFRGAFFLAAAYGLQTLEASMTKEISGISTTVNGKLETNYITPHVGWNWVWESGFFMGLDIGVQLATSVKTTITTDITNTAVTSSDEYTKLKGDVEDAANKVGKIPLPMFTFLKIGFYF